MLKEAAALILLDELKKEAALNNLLNFIKQAALDEDDVLPIAGAAGVGGLLGKGVHTLYSNVRLDDALLEADRTSAASQSRAAINMLLGPTADIDAMKRLNREAEAARASYLRRAAALRKWMWPAMLAGAAAFGGGSALYRNATEPSLPEKVIKSLREFGTDAKSFINMNDN